jgi:hypothetical protein
MWYAWSYPKVLLACARAGAHASDCIDGGVEGLVDVSLDGSRANDFCALAPADHRSACWKFVEARVARIRPR